MGLTFFNIFKTVIFLLLIIYFVYYIYRIVRAYINIKQYQYVILDTISSFIIFWIIIHGGVKDLFFWLPDSFGSFNNDGAYTTIKESIASLCAFAGAIVLPVLIVQATKYNSLSVSLKDKAEEESSLFDIESHLDNIPLLLELKQTYQAEIDSYDDTSQCPLDHYVLLKKYVDLRISDLEAYKNGKQKTDIIETDPIRIWWRNNLDKMLNKSTHIDKSGNQASELEHNTPTTNAKANIDPLIEHEIESYLSMNYNKYDLISMGYDEELVEFVILKRT